MNLFGIMLLAQLGTGDSLPVLEFPEPGLDDSAAYQGYRTRFYRDAAGNTVQIYLQQAEGRVVHLWANSDNESLGFTARDVNGRAAPLRWAGARAQVSDSAGARTLEYELVANAPHVHLGWFLLGSMRVERDFQYAGRHRAPFGGERFALPETERLLASLARLEPAERRRHIALLGAPDIRTLRGRLQPRIAVTRSDSAWVARVVQPSFEGRDTLALEIRADPREVIAARAGDSLSLQARSGEQVRFTVRISSSAEPLTPLSREQIFSDEFLEFARATRAAGERAAPGDSSAIRARWIERQMRGVELLSSREKLMAGLPNYGTYFGRDMMLSALMMRSIWRPEMLEFVVASVLRKLSPSGQVSHEEALGGQAVREGAAEYALLIEEHLRARGAGDRARADTLLARAREVLGDLRRVRENYNMIDDEFQLPVLAARWLSDPGVADERKRAFLLDAADGGEPRVRRLLRALGLIARLTEAYAREPIPANLVSFPPRDSATWHPGSWRDSNAGYAGGRYAMDVNAIWVPHALLSIGDILATLRALGLSTHPAVASAPELAAGTPLGSYHRDSVALGRAVEAWRGASRHFIVRLGPEEVRSSVAARLVAMPREERSYWEGVLAASGADGDSLNFLAVSLDDEGRPIGVANTDPATRLFLGEPGAAGNTRAEEAAERVLRDVRLFVRPYPVGLFIERVGPVVANDAYAGPAVWREFERDPYHGPRVVWGREVNLFLLGVAGHLSGSGEARSRGPGGAAPASAGFAGELRATLRQVLPAVEASGFQSELWSYELRGGRVIPVRYGTSSDVQLWSTTDLAVHFALSRLKQ